MGIFLTEEALETKQLQVMNEAYFGRTPGITRCFNAFCDFRDKYVEGVDVNGLASFVNSVKHINIRTDKNLNRWAEEMERQFGFFSFSPVIVNSTTTNQATFGTGLFGNGYYTKSPKDFIYMDKEGYHFKKEAEASCILLMFTGMLFDSRLSDEEMFAIILHEVGHNFQKFLSKDMFCLHKIAGPFEYIDGVLEDIINDSFSLTGLAVSTLSQTAETQNAFGSLYKSVLKTNSIAKFVDYLSYVSGLSSTIKEVMNLGSYLAIPAKLMRILFNIVAKLTKYIVLLPASAYNYFGEQIADNFPTYYGFGVGSATVQLYLQNITGSGLTDTINDLPIIGHFYSSVFVPIDIVSSIVDEHPNSSARIKGVISSMEHDLEDPRLSPKLKEQLKKEIKETKEAVDKHYELSTKITNPHIVGEVFNRFLYYSLNGGLKYNIHKKALDVSKSVSDTDIEDYRESTNYISNTKIR